MMYSLSANDQLLKPHRLEEKYRTVFNKTLSQKELAFENVEGSRFFFVTDEKGFPVLENGKPIPKKFDTYGIVCCLPFPEEFQQKLEDLWKNFLKITDNPISYGVELSNRHVEIFLFQRPEELFSEAEIKNGINTSLKIAKTIKPFKIKFSYPFMTPDGTIVVPGYDIPDGTIESFRNNLHYSLDKYPKKQSQWLHTSLGRILETADSNKLSPLLSDMESNWGKIIGEVKVKELLWTYEKQWYMLDKTILSRCILK